MNTTNIVHCSLHWIALKSTLPDFIIDKETFAKYYLPGEEDKVSYYGSYQGFLNYTRENVILDNVIIVDKVYHSTKVVSDSINYVDVVFDRKKLLMEPKQFVPNDFVLALKQSSASGMQIGPTDIFRNYYKEVLSTYHRVTFFDHFNTFKYIINKDLRKSLEEGVYRYFAKIDSLVQFRSLFTKVEQLLKPAQLEKYTPVKNFIFSVRTEVLLSLVSEIDQEKVRLTLDQHSLDYFDVNYLKAYLRDYGKTKEEKAKKKDKVQDLKFEDAINSSAEE